MHAEYVMHIAKTLGLRMPYPMTFADFEQRRFYGHGVRKVWFDDADCYIAMGCARRGVELAGMTVEVDRPCARECDACGRPVEADRQIYYTPVCHACLPPPAPLAVNRIEEG